MTDTLEQLYDDHAQAMFSFLLNLTRCEADTRDVLQEVFRKIAQRPEMMDGVRDGRGFLLRLAHNAAIDLMRRRTTREKNYAEFSQGAAQFFEQGVNADEEAFRRALATALGELPPEQRAVAHLKLWEGETFERIGIILSIPSNTAASRYRYAIDKLRGRLRPIYEEIQ